MRPTSLALHKIHFLSSLIPISKYSRVWGALASCVPKKKKSFDVRKFHGSCTHTALA